MALWIKPKYLRQSKNRRFGDIDVRLLMPDGTAVILAPHEDGIVVGTVGRKLPDGDYPQPSGLLVTGSDAEMLGALVECVEDAEVESILGIA